MAEQQNSATYTEPFGSLSDMMSALSDNASNKIKARTIRDSVTTVNQTISQSIDGVNQPKSVVISRKIFPNESNLSDVDLGGGIRVKPKYPLMLDLDLSKGNYYQIIIDDGIKSLQMPSDFADSLVDLVLRGKMSSPSVLLIRLSDYQNLSFVSIDCTNGKNDKRWTYKIDDDIIDLPHCGSVFLSGDKQHPCANVKPNLTLKMYHTMGMSISSFYLETLVVDFGNMLSSHVELGSYSSTEYYYNWLLLNFNPNLTTVSFLNLGYYPLCSSDSSLIFNFSNCNLKKSSIDSILYYFDSAFPNFVSGVLNLQNDHMWATVNSGESLVIGEQYYCVLSEGDDFSNIGYVSDYTLFTATGTTPTSWYYGTQVFAVAGVGNEVEVASFVGNLPDGDYNLTPSPFFITCSGGTITNVDIINVSASNDYIGKEVVFTSSDFVKWDLSDTSRGVTFIGDPSNVLVLRWIGIARNAIPTDDINNSNKLSLESKGWSVQVNAPILPPT